MTTPPLEKVQIEEYLAADLASLPVAVMGLVAGILGLYLAAKGRGTKQSGERLSK